MKACVSQKQLHATSWHASSACGSRTHVRQRQQQPRAAAACRAHARPLLLDNYDSYTYNLYQIIAEAYGVDPLVLHNDEVDISTIKQMLAVGDIHHIVLSPGPGTPHNPRDIGVCMDVLQQCHSTPVLGVCLGQQAMAVAAGGQVVRAPEPVHGRLSTLEHSGHELFAGCPSGPGSGFDVVRYHSLVVDSSSLPPELEALAWTCSGHSAVSLDHPQLHVPASTTAAAAAGPDRLLMALRHRQRPHCGLQFHPESVATRYGVQLLHNFRDLACRHSGHDLRQRQQWSLQQQQQQQQQQNHQLLGQQQQDRHHLQQQNYQQQQQRQQVNLVGPPGREMPPRPWPTLQPAATKAAAAAAVGSNGSNSSEAQQQPQQQQQQIEALAGCAPAGCVGAGGLQLLWQRLPGAAAAVTGGSATLFEKLVGPGPDTLWLDSSSAPERARFSYMGGPGLGTGPLWRRVTYKLPPPQPAGATAAATAAGGSSKQQPSLGRLAISQQQSSSQTWQQQQQQEQVVEGSVFDYLQAQLQQLQLQPACAAAAAAELPFNLWSGFVGYLGYECKAECGGANAHAAPGPDAAWLFADRLLVVDHVLGDVWLLALTPAAGAAAAVPAPAGAAAAAAAAQAWLDSTADRVQQLVALSAPLSTSSSSGVIRTDLQQQLAQQQQSLAADSISSRTADLQQQQQRLRHGRAAYVSNARACKAAMVAGESYELCLTTSYTLGGPGAGGMQQPPEAWDFYSTLRSINPAPYSAWLSIAASSPAPAVTVCCSSPERFLSCGRGGVLEAKPIKGTARRHPGDAAADWASAAALLGSEKERAENLMIVDLLRNDLGRVCEPGSVHVPGLIQLESYSSVHQLVSTVRGLLRADASCIDAVRAAFPGGSMTGAPKVRSMQILDELEGGARGVYSGALGYLSVNGTFDLNIVIRTAVFVEQQQQQDLEGVTAGCSRSSAGSSTNGRVMTIGAGGAITVQSDPEAEFAEMQLKAERLLVAAGLAAQQQQQQQQQQVRPVEEQEMSEAAAGAAAAAAAAAAVAVCRIEEPVRR